MASVVAWTRTIRASCCRRSSHGSPRSSANTFPPSAHATIVASRLCLDCDTFDGDFFIAPDPDRAGLVVAAGDSGHAFKFAPVLGGVIADVVEGKPNAWAPRFRWRTRGQDAKEAARAMATDGSQ